MEPEREICTPILAGEFAKSPDAHLRGGRKRVGACVGRGKQDQEGVIQSGRLRGGEKAVNWVRGGRA
jgi:hypothetical protein